MITNNDISYRTRQEIDILKWDQCIESSYNGLIYAQSFYLDIMCDNWDALIFNDYEAVMPLTWRRKYGFYYLYQPYFVPFLGIFGKKIMGVTVKDFLLAIPEKFKYWNIDLNDANDLMNAENELNLKITKRRNYFLNLQSPYNDIYTVYSKACKRRIRKAGQQQVEIIMGDSHADVIAFYRRHYESKYPKILPAVYDRLIAAAGLCLQKGLAKIYLAKLPDGETTAAYLVLLDKNFVYLLFGGSSEKGKQTASFYLITDKIIKDHCGSRRMLRFEGSDIPGIALFNAQFGTTEKEYLHINCNKLPFPVNLLKR